MAPSLEANPRSQRAGRRHRSLGARRGALLAGAVPFVASLCLAACGGGDSGGSTSAAVADRPAPPVSDFPPARGQTLNQVLNGSDAQRSNLVVAPTGRVYEKGENRFGFGVFTVARQQVVDAQVAIYAAPSGGGKAVGPFPARIESLEVKPQFQSATTQKDPDSAKAVYVTNVKLDRDGNWDLVAMIKSGDGYSATLVPSIRVGGFKDIPAVGSRPPAMHTPTVADVGGDVAQIDTRTPHDDMHGDDFADVVGKRPVVLLFATPALCQSRVCGPVVDIAEQVKHEAGDGVSFIHQEVYNHNNASDGLRPQMEAFGLPSEPWLFVIGRDGKVSARIEGAFDASELEDAVRRVQSG